MESTDDRNTNNIKSKDRYRCNNCGFIFKSNSEYVECSRCGGNCVEEVQVVI